MVIPGDVAEMTEFQEKTMNNSRFIVELCLPNVQLVLPSKAFYEKLSNRYRTKGVKIKLLNIYKRRESNIFTFRNVLMRAKILKKCAANTVPMEDSFNKIHLKRINPELFHM